MDTCVLIHIQSALWPESRIPLYAADVQTRTPYGSSVMEDFFGTLMAERLDGARFTARDEGRLPIA